MHVKIYLVHCRTDSDGSNEFSLLFDKSRTKRSRHQWNNVLYCRFCLFFSYIEENLLIFQKQADFVGIIHNIFKSIIFKLTLLVKQNGKTDYKYFQKCQRILKKYITGMHRYRYHDTIYFRHSISV